MLLVAAVMMTVGVNGAKATETPLWTGTIVGGTCYNNYGGNDASLTINANDLKALNYAEGNKIRVYVTLNQDDGSEGRWKFYIANDWYQSLSLSDWKGNSSDNLYEYNDPNNYNAEEGYIEVTLSATSITQINNSGKLRIHVLGLTMTKVSLITGADSPVATTHTLTYIIDGQSTTMQVAEGATITLPTPYKEGYTFTEWLGLPNDGKMPGGNLTVTAQFRINSYTLTYKVDGEVYGNVETIQYGAAITAREEPTREGYTFSGWSSIPATMPAHNVEVTGTFTKNKEYVQITIGTSGYATFSSTKAIDLNTLSGVTAYYAKAVSTTEATLAAVTGAVAANTGLLLVGSAGSYSAEVIETGSTISNNLLVAVSQATTINAANKYVLTNESGEVKFADTQAHPAVIPAGKAYLLGPASNGSRMLRISFSDATGIQGIITNSNDNNTIFDMRGMRVKTPAKGLYIINGKKVFIK